MDLFLRLNMSVVPVAKVLTCLSTRYVCIDSSGAMLRKLTMKVVDH